MKILKRIPLLLSAIISLAIFTSPALVLAQTTTTTNNPAQAQSNKDAVCSGIGLTGGNCTTDPGPTLNTVITTVINLLSLLVGVTSVIMVIVGGFKYVTSAGDANSIGSAKNTIMYALVGLVIAAMAQVIVKFTLGRASQPPTCTATVTTNCTPPAGTPAPAPGGGTPTPAPGGGTPAPSGGGTP